ncbi:MAG TPA: hypothetical protein VNZ49_05945 [Bacteroidia bacterium]|jgi:hypothetical protein|nr:hypothetical protein [Bacteroidia bacterium]
MKIVNTPIAQLSFDLANNILHIKVYEGANMNLENARTHYQKINSLVGARNYFALVDASNHYTIEEEAWKYASLPKIIFNRKAVAQYNIALSNRLTATYFTVNYKTSMPFKVFSTKDNALIWLKSLS